MEIKFAVVQEFCSPVFAMKIFCSVFYCRGDPFEVDPLPKSFYYPSMQRELSEAERKVSLRRQSARPPGTYKPGVLNR